MIDASCYNTVDLHHTLAKYIAKAGAAHATGRDSPGILAYHIPIVSSASSLVLNQGEGESFVRVQYSVKHPLPYAQFAIHEPLR